MNNRKIISLMRRKKLTASQRKRIRTIISEVKDPDQDGIPFYKDNDEGLIDVVRVLHNNKEELAERWTEVKTLVERLYELLNDIAELGYNVADSRETGQD